MTSISLSARAADAPINYEDHILPIIRSNCASCHNPDKKRGDVILDSYRALLDSDVVADGDPESSVLYLVISHTEEPNMPPEQPKLPDTQIELFKKWIAGGLREKSTSEVAKSKKPKTSLKLASTPNQRPAGPPPMPEHLLLEPVHSTARASSVRALAASPWAPLFAIGSLDQILLVHTETYRLLGVLPFPEGLPYVLRFSRNGRLLLAAGGRGGQSGRAVLYDVVTGDRLLTVGNEYDAILAADLSPDQREIAIGGASKLIKIYSTDTGELVDTIKKHSDWLMGLAYSPDGVLLASADRSGGLFVWEAWTKQLFYDLRGHKAGVNAIAWRGDANILVSADEEGRVMAWAMQDGNRLKNFVAHGGGTLSVDFDKRGQLVSSGRDRRVKTWDANGKAIRTFEPMSDIALVACFTSDDKRVIAGDWQGEVSEWLVDGGARQFRASPVVPTIASRIELATSQCEKAKLASEAAQTVHQKQHRALEQATSELDRQQQLASRAEARMRDLKTGLAAIDAIGESHRESIAKTEQLCQLIELERQTLSQQRAEFAKLTAQLNASLAAATSATARDEMNAKLEGATSRAKGVDEKVAQVTERAIACQKLLDGQRKTLAALQKQRELSAAAVGALEPEFATTHAPLAELEKTKVASAEAEAMASAEAKKTEGVYVAAERELNRWRAAEMNVARFAARDALRSRQGELDVAQTEFESATGQAHELASALAAIEQSIASAPSDLQAADEMVTAAEAKLGLCQEHHALTIANAEQIDALMADADAWIARLQERAAADPESTELGAALESAKQSKAHLIAERERTQRAIDAAAAEIDLERAAIGDAKAERARREEVGRTLPAKRRAKQAEIATQMEVVTAVEGVVAKATAARDAAKAEFDEQDRRYGEQYALAAKPSEPAAEGALKAP